MEVHDIVKRGWVVGGYMGNKKFFSFISTDTFRAAHRTGGFYGVPSAP